MAIVEALMHRQNLTPEEDELFDLLVTLIEKFEEEYYPLGQSSTPHSILLFLMEQQDIRQSDLVEVIGSGEIVSEAIIDKREISKSEAKALG